mmetsp:Transcript_41307/g.129894  ORF Transcript_41307/g.129894 Transcript_41307/m.129894 type:complete len:218 (-) Transcript_41307:705-1358(-)
MCPSFASFLSAATVLSVTPSINSLSFSTSSPRSRPSSRRPRLMSSSLSSSDNSNIMLPTIPLPSPLLDWFASSAFSSAPCRALTISSTISSAFACPSPSRSDDASNLITRAPPEFPCRRSSMEAGRTEACDAWWCTRYHLPPNLRNTLVASIRRSVPGEETSSVQVTKAEVPRTCTFTLEGVMAVLLKALSRAWNMFRHMFTMLSYPSRGFAPGWMH